MPRSTQMRVEVKGNGVGAIPGMEPYSVIACEADPDNSPIKVSGTKIGGNQLTIIAGPYLIENSRQAFTVAETVRESGAKFFRVALTPRPEIRSTDHASIEDALRIIANIRDRLELNCVVEVVDDRTLDIAEHFGDVIQIEARNMQNFPLLRQVSHSRLPVILKRGPSATIDEWLFAAKYIMAGGNQDVVLCESGIRTFNHHTNETLDLACIPYIRRISHLPIIVDPSESSGQSHFVTPLASAAVAAGADGLLVEITNSQDPTRLTGALDLTQYKQMVARAMAIREVVQRCPREAAAAALR